MKGNVSFILLFRCILFFNNSYTAQFSVIIEHIAYTTLVVNLQLRDGVHFSYDQLLDGLEFIGNDYGKFIEIFNEQTKKFYDINTSKTYFDCSNFYFEIDREDDFRRKGPSKENRKDPIVGLGLLLDANQIQIGRASCRERV